MRRNPWLPVPAVAAALLAATPAAHAGEVGRLKLGLGAFDFEESEGTTFEGRGIWEPGLRVFDTAGWFGGFGPLVGIMGNADGGVFGHGAIFADIRIGEHVRLRPQGGIGGYRQGDSKDLGGVFQFHLALEAAWRFDNGHEIGIMAAHISNADIRPTNPGANSLLLTWSVPTDALF